MNKQGPVWQRILIFLFLGGASFVIPFLLPSSAPSGCLPISVLLGSWLILEALAQPNPSAQKTPLYMLIGRYPQRRDKFVAGISLGTFLLAFLLSTFLLRDMDGLNWIVQLLLIILSLLIAAGLYFAVGFYFGSQELREIIIPKILKRFLEQRNQAAK